MNEIIAKLENHIGNLFLIDFDIESLENELAIFENSSSDFLEEINLSFKENLLSIVTTAKIPEIMAVAKANLEIFNSILTEERILSLKITDENTFEDNRNKEKQKEKDLKALQKTKSRFYEERKEVKGKNRFSYLTLTFLKSISDDPTFIVASKNLINQCTLSLWTAFEVYCRDCFVILLNKKNELVERLSEVPELKQKLNLKALPIKKLSEYNYDLSNHMGNILIENFEFSNVETIRLVYKNIFDNKNIIEMLCSEQLWLLYKRRNLFVHKSGIVDKQYLESTSDNLTLNSKLIVTPIELVQYIKFIIEIAINIKKEIENYLI